MSKGLGQRTPTDKLVYRLRLMADSGGMLSRDRIRTVIEAADRLSELDEQVASMEKEREHHDMIGTNVPDDRMVPIMRR